MKRHQIIGVTIMIIIAFVVGFVIGQINMLSVCVDAGFKILKMKGVELDVDADFIKQAISTYKYRFKDYLENT